jgi:hypothetical protein
MGRYGEANRILVERLARRAPTKAATVLSAGMLRNPSFAPSRAVRIELANPRGKVRDVFLIELGSALSGRSTSRRAQPRIRLAFPFRLLHGLIVD